MAKENRRLNVKGFLDKDEGVIIEHDKDLGDIIHKLDDLLCRFSGLDDVTLTLSHETEIEGDQK